MSKSPKATTRRDFLKTSAAGLAALSIIPSHVLARSAYQAPGDKLNIAAIGVGGAGYTNLLHLEKENIVALCDVDEAYARKAVRRWSNAAYYTDFRRMLENEKQIDAVLIATPDHTHSVAAMAAMQLQKHVFVQTPMAHAIFEARRMTETARVYNVVAQEGNQHASTDQLRAICEILWAGSIGEIEKVHVASPQPHWQQGGYYPDKKMRVPKTLNWDLFVGPAPMIDYNDTYTPFGWRAWWNFGNGALAAAGPRLLAPVFSALKLEAPVKVQASSSEVNLQSAPEAEKIVFEFARRDNLPRLAMPPVKLYWYDGGIEPEIPAQLPAGLPMGNDDGYVIFEGSEGLLVCGSGGENYAVLKNGELVEPRLQKQLPRIMNPLDGGHELDWVRACKENPQNRLAPSASFDQQAALNETILLGTIAVRIQSLGKNLEWDSAQLRFTNVSPYEEFEIVNYQPLYIQNGIPRLDKEVEKHNVVHFVNQLVRPVYRNGWEQI
ncbi:Gfo/Idh/MocA family oxidoreductase [Roseimarinus sediminis]|jgi:predicted dehydrogenase|uniref:Gfo/Idh/MocA family oxidoreductase n=1 Tax=Roseimarinus sediminis TaxID=1610899 RepID=UPI003D247496